MPVSKTTNAVSYVKPLLILISIVSSALSIYFVFFAQNNAQLDYSKILVKVSIAIALLANALPNEEE